MFRTALASAVLVTFVAVSAHAQAPQPAPAGAPGARAGGALARASRPALFRKEEWKQTLANDEHTVTQDSIGNPNLELKLYGASSKEIQLTGRAGDETNPIHIW